MKKIKKLLSVLMVTSIVCIGITQISTVKASACSSSGHQYVKFGMDNYPDIIFSTKMIKQHSGYVYNIQWVLNHIGYDAGTPDGYYGSSTYNAVYNFQSNHQGAPWNLGKPDGVVGPATWQCLKDHCV